MLAVLTSLSLLPALACVSEAEVDHVYEREHERIDHDYDRREQLVEQVAKQAHELIDHGYDRQQGMFEQMFALVSEAGPPAGFGPSTCTFSSTPSGAEVYELDLHDRWRFVGKTPLTVERPLMHARPIELRAPGFQPAHGHMLSDAVLGPCVEHFELAPW